VRLFFACVFIVALVLLVAQLRADPRPETQTMTMQTQQVPMAVKTQFPEPISTVFVLAGASAMGLWKIARKLRLI